MPSTLSLRERLGSRLSERVLSDARTTLSLADAAGRGWAAETVEKVAGRSVILAMSRQLETALALVALDGVARRILLCPPDLAPERRGSVIAEAGIEAVVCDDPQPWRDLGVPLVAPSGLPLAPPHRISAEHPTEWLMLTSGTTGTPKIVAHTLAALTGAITPARPAPSEPPVWATFYDIRRYGGLQVLLRALVGGGSMVLSEPGEPIADHLARLQRCGVTHVSGTPSHWRKAMMTSAISGFTPCYVRLSGEIADQAVLDGLRACFPAASIEHAYASTEAGVAFAVGDGREGFPSALLERSQSDVAMKVEDGSLRIRSTRSAHGYVGSCAALADANGFIDTGDLVERRGDRYHFVGRRGGIINVGGLKVHPEEVEAVINRRREVRMSRVKARRSPITGSIVIADVVLAAASDAQTQEEVRRAIVAECRKSLEPHKVPAVIRFVPSLEVTASGKLLRHA